MEVLKTINQEVVNYAPSYLAPPQKNHEIEVYERDLITKNATVYVYQSPNATDYEDDRIYMEFRNQWRFPYLELESQVYPTASSFSLKIDKSKLNYLDRGLYDFDIMIYDKYHE